MIESNRDKLFSWYHAALILTKKIPVGSVTANKKLTSLLNNLGNLEDIYNSFYGMFPIDESIESQLDKKYNKVEFDFHTITINDSNYPEKLRSVEGATPVLYCRGDLSLLEASKTISFVGTRELTDPAHLEHGEAVIKRLLDAGHQAIVSGLASGSDTLGHRTALKYSGRTIAVLGTPLDQYFPKENWQLQDEIAKNHLLISEYPIGIRSFGSFFANRNRTTVALSSEGVVVARAGDRSGTQYAIRHCVEQNKQLYALVNNVLEPDYNWVHKYKKSIKIIR